MSKFRFTLNILAVAAFLLTVTSMANAQATRTWVSGVGDDANPCSRTAPCKTFAGAISKTIAGGEIDCLDPGGFGAVTITKSLTIDGTHGAGFGSILASSTNGIIINGSGAIVTLRSLSINGGPPTSPGINGIRFLTGSKLLVEDCKIFNFTTTGADQGAGIDIKMTATGSSVEVKDSTIYNNTRGIRATTTVGSVGVLIDNCHIENNSQNNVLMENGGFTTIRASTIAFSVNGVNLTGGGNSGANLIDTTVAGCTGAGLASANNTSRIGGSSFLGNTTDISQSAANTVKTFGDNNISGTISGGALQLTPQQ
jgi:hypothetical protein